MAPTKQCGSCGEHKPFEDFYKDKGKADGHQYYCKVCQTPTPRKLLTPEEIERKKEINARACKKYREKNYEKIAAYQQEYNKRRPKERRQEQHLFYYHKIQPQTYNSMFQAQNGCCAICGTHQNDLPRRLVVDHDHETAKIRSLLCHKCNMGIGLLNEDPQIIQTALRYIYTHKGAA